MNSIIMTVGQEGPTVSRAPGQQLTIGVDVDAAEAERLIEAGFAKPGDDVSTPPSAAKPKPVRGKSATASA